LKTIVTTAVKLGDPPDIRNSTTERDNSKDEIIIAYLEKNYIPEIQILDKNRMTCDGIEYKIIDYINLINEKIKKIKDINDNSNDILDDNNYDICGLCKYNLNEYFCENCNKNICNNCYKNCNEEKHKIQSLEKIKDEFKTNVFIIRNIFNRCIIPIKKEENKIDKKNLDIKEEFKENIDILLIYDIISLNYNNYFHYKNAKNILSYCWENYLSFLKQNNYEGKGKILFYDGRYLKIIYQTEKEQNIIKMEILDMKVI